MLATRRQAITLRFAGKASCGSQSELDVRAERLPIRAEELIQKTVKKGLRGRATIDLIRTEFLPKKPINNMPVEFRLAVVIVATSDVRLGVCDYVGSAIVQEYNTMFGRCDEICD